MHVQIQIAIRVWEEKRELKSDLTRSWEVATAEIMYTRLFRGGR